jgi:hypothetical protein
MHEDLIPEVCSTQLLQAPGPRYSSPARRGAALLVLGLLALSCVSVTVTTPPCPPPAPGPEPKFPIPVITVPDDPGACRSMAGQSVTKDASNSTWAVGETCCRGDQTPPNNKHKLKDDATHWFCG